MVLSKEKIEYFKEKLEKEKKRLEEQIQHLARKNPDVPGDWEPVPEDMNVLPADKNELADTFEELEERVVMEDNLEEELTYIREALEKIEKGGYGICETCGKEIEMERLEALPAAKNCIKHAKNK